jgi:hypothetical protein
MVCHSWAVVPSQYRYAWGRAVALGLLVATAGCVRSGFEPASILGSSDAAAERGPDARVVGGDGFGDARQQGLALTLRDPLTGRSDRVRSRVLEVAISGDEGAERWCVTSTVASAALEATAPCAGGQGTAAGWWTVRPTQHLLPAQDGSYEVFLWVADAAGRVSRATEPASLLLDTVVPPAPALAVVDVDTGSALVTATGEVEVTVGRDPDASAWCLIEAAASEPSPAPPAHGDPCFVALPPARLQLAVLGQRVLWAFARDEAWNISATPGSARIEWREDGGLAAFVWVGRAGDAAFSNPANWSTRLVPGPTDLARFDGHCGLRCACTIDAPTSVGGLDLAASYPGTLRQGLGQALTVGGSGIVIAGGTLRGGDSPIDVNGNVTLSGGRFESTSATFSIGITTEGHNPGGLTVSGGQFVAGTGTLVFDGSKGGGLWTEVARIDAVAPLVLDRLVVSVRDPETTQGQNGAVLRLGAATRVIVQSELTLRDGKLVGGTIELRGNLTTTCTGGGVCAEGGLTPVIVNGSGTQTYGGAGTGPVLVVDTAGSCEPAQGTTSYALSGLKLVRGSFVSPTGTLRFHFDREYGLPIPHADEGFRIVGGTFVNRLSALAIEPWVSTEANQNALPIDVGTLDVPTLRIELDDYNLRYGYNNEWIGLAPTTVLRVAGAFTLTDGRLEGGRIEVGGDAAFYCASERSCAGGGTTELVLRGSGTQSLYQQIGAFTAQLPGGTLLLNRSPSAPAVRALSELRLAAQSQALRLLSGALTTEGRALSVAGLLTLEVGTTLTLAGGTLSYGSLVNNGGVVQP